MEHPLSGNIPSPLTDITDLSGKGWTYADHRARCAARLVAGRLLPRAGAYNANWGYAPVGLGTILIIVLLVLVLQGGV
jgi:hypothetical protein